MISKLSLVFYKKMFQISYWFLFLLITGSIVHSVTGIARLNWAYVVIEKSWLSTGYSLSFDTRLQDKIPDSWSASNWANARAILKIDQQYAYSGKNSAYIKKNNDQDSSVFVQSFTKPTGQDLECGVFHKGTEAFVQLIGAGINATSLLARAETWQATKMSFRVPVDRAGITLFVGLQGSQGEVWFDDIYCWLLEDGSRNLLSNSSFEADGVMISAVDWWHMLHAKQFVSVHALEAAQRILLQSPSTQFSDRNYLNVIDMLLNRQTAVMERAKDMPLGCTADANPAPYLELGKKFQHDGNLTAYEKMLQLSMILMPMCPQSYAQLAELYESVNAFSRAAEFYSLAAQYARPGPQQGRYFFSEGKILVEQTGEWNLASKVLTAASQQTGWEPATWYYGAASIYLGQALLEAGHCNEAKEVYQKVLDCIQCTVRHEEVQLALTNSVRCKPGQK